MDHTEDGGQFAHHTKWAPSSDCRTAAGGRSSGDGGSGSAGGRGRAKISRGSAGAGEAETGREAGWSEAASVRGGASMVGTGGSMDVWGADAMPSWGGRGRGPGMGDRTHGGIGERMMIMEQRHWERERLMQVFGVSVAVCCSC